MRAHVRTLLSSSSFYFTALHSSPSITLYALLVYFSSTQNTRSIKAGIPVCSLTTIAPGTSHCLVRSESVSNRDHFPKQGNHSLAFTHLLVIVCGQGNCKLLKMHDPIVLSPAPQESKSKYGFSSKIPCHVGPAASEPRHREVTVLGPIDRVQNQW